MNWLKNLINLILYWFGQVKDSKPDPLPDPVPDPVPDPDPGHEESLVLLDLPQTAVKMFQAGFPGREGVLLYALGQVANGWPIPGQSEELITIASFYDHIVVWYE